MPPILTLQADNGENRPRGMTASTVSTATPTNAEDAAFDLGGDFGSMFTSFDKRASVATLKSNEAVQPRVLTGHRNIQPAPISPDTVTSAEPLLGQRHGPDQDDTSPSAYDAPPPVPRHQASGGSFKYSHRPSDIVEDEDAKLLRESFTAMKFLSSDPNDSAGRTQTQRHRRDEDMFTAAPPKPIASTFSKEDNMFEGSLSRFSKTSHRYAPRVSSPAQNKVMTPAQFEKYRQDRERGGSTEQVAQAAAKDDEDEDEINYDDDDDEQEKSKQQAKQRRKQEAHMAVYRQQMMKVTGETASAPVVNRNSRPGLLPSTSAPQLSHMKAPSPEPGILASDEDDDEDVPLGILQAHGFPGKNRPPTRLSHAGSNSNLRALAPGGPPGRPASTAGESISNASRPNSMLPAFARNLPQDPFVGASIARPAVRESLAFGDAGHPPQQQGPSPPGGLVGVIVSEERSRAMRRGSPSLDNRGMMAAGSMSGHHPQGFDAATGFPHQMMFNAGGMPGMPGMSQMQQMHQPPPMLTPGDQAQIQMTQQMQQFMQMQMQFMQMMAGNQSAGNHPMQPPMQPPYGVGFPANQSMVDLSSRHSAMGEPMMMDPRRMEHGMRTMSMVQPSSASFIQQPQYTAPSVRDSYAGYAPSIAPSERSNVGLPGRYRPVSQAAQSSMPDLHQRASTMSGGLSGWNSDKNKSTVKVVNKADGSDDDDEEGWEAMKAKREKKRSLWRSKKSYGNELAL